MSTHSQSASCYELKRCVHCDATHKSKDSLDDHVVKKHPSFIPTLDRTIHECTDCGYKTTSKPKLYKHRSLLACTKCDYKTVLKGYFQRHNLIHHDSASNYKQQIPCAYCAISFKNMVSLDDHYTLIDICRHIPCYELKRCVHCNAAYKSKDSLDDHLKNLQASLQHLTGQYTNVPNDVSFFFRIPKNNLPRTQHPVANRKTGKTFKCTECSYKTTVKRNLQRHLSMHPKFPSNCTLFRCIHCNNSFKKKISLDDHVVKNHPSFISSVTAKLYECTKCNYKTVLNGLFVRHGSIHHNDNEPRIPCSSCEASFAKKVSLDEHIVKKHPGFITSVFRKIYECGNCDYKTTIKCNLNRHTSTHSKSTLTR
nr:unnamed protein product [Callosobruchus analis]